MKRYSEAGMIEGQMYTFFLTEATKIGLSFKDLGFSWSLDSISIKVFLQQKVGESDIEFYLGIKDLKFVCNEIIKTYKHINIHIIFFSVTKEDDIDYQKMEKTK